MGPTETCNSGANHDGLLAPNDKWGLGPIPTCNSAPQVSVLLTKTTDERWEPFRLVIPMLGIEILIQSRCFACENNRWGLVPMETSNSYVNHVVLHAQNDRWELGPIETCNSGAKGAVLIAKNHSWSLGPIETCNYEPKVAVLHAKPTEEGWDP